MTEPTNRVAAKIKGVDFLDGGADVGHTMVMIITDDLDAPHYFWTSPAEFVRLAAEMKRVAKKMRTLQGRDAKH